jgi:hypothetical protein
MKKLFAIMLALTLIVAFAGQAAAATDISGVNASFGTAEQTGEEMFYSLSNKVNMDYNANSVDYALGAKHFSGNRIYYTTNNTSNIYYLEDDTYKGTTSVLTIPGIGSTDLTGFGTAM